MSTDESMQIYEDAQTSLISALLYYPGQVKLVRGMLQPEDFGNNVSKVLYESVISLDDENKAPNYPNMVMAMTENGTIGEVGGVEGLSTFFNMGSQTQAIGDAIDSYARTIKQISAKLKLAKLTEKLHQQAEDPKGSAIDVIRDGQKELDNVLMGLNTMNNTVRVGEYFGSKYMDKVQQKVKIYEETGGDPLAAQGGIPSSFATLNKQTGGWLPGQLNVVGARTGVGKSFFLVNEVVEACSRGYSVLFFSLEMLVDELLDRFTSCYSQRFEGYKPIRLSTLKNGSVRPDEKDNFNATLQVERDGMMIGDTGKRLPGFSEFKLDIDTSTNLTIEHIRAKAQQMKISENGLDLIVLDYLQLVQSSGMKKNREQQVAEVSRALKQLSMELKIPIIVAVQLNRVQKGDEDPTPTLNDIRESNSIAQDASVILLIDRSTKKNSQGGYDPSTFILDKNRNGSSGIRFKCRTQLNYAAFLEMDDAEGSVDDTEPDHSDEWSLDDDNVTQDDNDAILYDEDEFNDGDDDEQEW